MLSLSQHFSELVFLSPVFCLSVTNESLGKDIQVNNVQNLMNTVNYRQALLDLIDVFTLCNARDVTFGSYNRIEPVGIFQRCLSAFAI